jgi:hypothetical protein
MRQRAHTAALLHVAQNERFVGKHEGGSGVFACEQDPPFGGQAARRGWQAAPVHGSEDGLTEVASNGGMQLIQADGV